ncbi:MAG: enoyl-CoA hydratase/isomerase family protein [Acidobacteria bacterium]|nr:enoyl-CoA hydratase/isomerase family protein [Acidobacteriota bacterium]
MSTNTDVTRHGRVAVLRVNRPEVCNALDLATVREMTRALADLTTDPDVGAIVVTGAGDKVFVSGADINDIRARGRDDGLAAINSSLFAAIDACPKVTIAAVNGLALGGGCELALACDLRVAATHAKFGQPEVALGIIPGAGATQRLPRIIGLGRAKYLVLTGDTIDAAQALDWGLVSRVVPGDEVMTAARALAERVLSRGPLAIRLAKVALNASARVDLESGLLIETLAQAICFESEDKQEGTTAFLEKRPPQFDGR